MPSLTVTSRARFQPTRPVRGGTRGEYQIVFNRLNNFNPPAPCGAGPGIVPQFGDPEEYFNPPAPCGAGLTIKPRSPPLPHFNPPAPCGAGLPFPAGTRRNGNFNPPAPCGAGPFPNPFSRFRLFNFNPPAPCGAGRFLSSSYTEVMSISTHPPRAGRDSVFQSGNFFSVGFQPTRPVRDGTAKLPLGYADVCGISTHPPRAGRDLLRRCHPRSTCRHFNPPAPCGAGLLMCTLIFIRSNHFNPPAPCGAGLRADVSHYR